MQPGNNCGQDLRRKRALAGILAAAAISGLVYAAAYIAFRLTHTQVWERDGNAYIIFPKDMPVVYYVFRPLSYVDGALTGMRFHIGPHR
ncbi:MAG: hypothetical protein N3D11_16665 [Candidatus Sumerlaeia bacterium]|nr:hypothetical protein [Candidatus Sumerlaeia bacterium]